VRGTREKNYDSFDWNYEVMRNYGNYAVEISQLGPIGPITCTAWRIAMDAGVGKEIRPALSEKDIEKGWNNKQIRIEADKITGEHRRRKKAVIYDGKTKKFINGYGELDQPSGTISHCFLFFPCFNRLNNESPSKIFKDVVSSFGCQSMSSNLGT